VKVLPALVALAIAGCSRVSLDDLIFFPDPNVPAPPPGVSERWLDAADGVRLHAWYAPARGDAPTLVWSHGNGGNMGGRGGVLVALATEGVGVLAYDYRRYGKSAGRPSEAGVYLDGEAAYDALRADGVPASRLVAFGESLGSAVSLHLALRRPCAGVALVSPFTTMRDVARHHYGPLGVLAGRRFDSLSRVTQLAVPLLVVHGDRDDIVPFALGERLFAAAPEPKRFLRVPGAGHNDVFRPTVVRAVAAFAREVTR
jgi:hypothetical protein